MIKIKDREALQKIYLKLISISWKTQTIIAREKWEEVKDIFSEVDITCKQDALKEYRYNDVETIAKILTKE